MKTKLKLAVAEDSAASMNLLKFSLQSFPHIHCSIFAHSGKQLLEQITDDSVPDVVLMDIMMPELNGIQTTIKLLEKYPKVKVMAFTLFDNEGLLDKMHEAGALGFAFKNDSYLNIIEQVVLLHKGELNQRTELFIHLLNEFRNSEERNLKLSPNETKVLVHICSGLINKEIADRMGLRLGTINAYRHQLLEKTGSSNTADLICYAIRAGLHHPQRTMREHRVKNSCISNL